MFLLFSEEQCVVSVLSFLRHHVFQVWNKLMVSNLNSLVADAQLVEKASVF